MHPFISQVLIQERQQRLAAEAAHHRLLRPVPPAPSAAPRLRPRLERLLVAVGQRLAGHPAPVPERPLPAGTPRR